MFSYYHFQLGKGCYSLRWIHLRIWFLVLKNMARSQDYKGSQRKTKGIFNPFSFFPFKFCLPLFIFSIFSVCKRCQVGSVNLSYLPLHSTKFIRFWYFSGYQRLASFRSGRRSYFRRCDIPFQLEFLGPSSDGNQRSSYLRKSMQHFIISLS